MHTLTTAPAPVVRAIGARVPVATEPQHLSLAVLGPPVFAIAVEGEPYTQGSISFKGMRGGKPILVASGEAQLTRWRGKVAAAAIAAMPSGWQALDGPLVMDLVVSLPRLTGLPKLLRRLPHTKPDLDKLARSAGDALGTDTKALKRPVIAEDSRIVAYRRLEKVYAGDSYDTDALRRPGAVIRLWRYPAAYLDKMEALNG